MLASDQEWTEEEPQAEQGHAQHAEAQPGHGLVVKQVEEVGDHQLAKGEAPADPCHHVGVHDDVALAPLQARG